MNILYICYHNPFGYTGGGAMASHAYLRAFADVADGNIDLMCASYLKGQMNHDLNLKEVFYIDDRSIFSKLASVFTGFMNRYVEAAKTLLNKNPHKYDWVVFDHNNIAGPLMDCVNSLGIRSVTIHHNYEKEYFADNNSLLCKLLFLHHVIRWEKKSFLQSSLNLFLTQDDENTFSEVYGNPDGKCAIIGTFEFADYIPAPIENKGLTEEVTFAITGSLCAYQTEDAIRYFFSELYPYLPVGSKLIVAGRNPSAEIQQLCSVHNNVLLVPNPQNMSEVISSANIYLCATRIGGGLKLRVMDGLKLGLPVITHKCSARGFDAFYSEDCFKSFSTPEEFGQCVQSVIDGLHQGIYDRHRVQSVYKNNFSYDAGLSRLKSILSIVR